MKGQAVAVRTSSLPERGAEGRWRWVGVPLMAYGAVRLLSIVIVLAAHGHTVAGGLAGWDGKWFLMGAEHGWPRHLPMVDGHVAANPIAFFPLLPMIVGGIAWTGINASVVGVLLSMATGALAVVAVGVAAAEFADLEQARRAALLFALFPGSFVFSFIYSEGLLITAVALGLVMLLRERWLLAGLLGLVATASSPVGFAFVVSCGVAAGIAVWRRRDVSSLLAPALAPLGGIAWMGFLWIHTGQWNAWRMTERGGWNSYPSLRYPFHIVAQVVFDPLRPTLTGYLLFFGTVAAVLGTILAVKERQPVPVLIYAIAAEAMALISAPVGLRPRFLLIAFPLIIAVATRFSGRTYQVIVTISGGLLVAMTAMAIFSNAVFP